MSLGIQPADRGCIFISYRRDDARGASGRLYDWLRIGFGRERVFRDVQSIGVGKWRDKIDAALTRSAVCVVVIGRRWANADNLHRLHDGDDMVRYELVTALARSEITLVPTLVEDAKTPPIDDLPEVLRPLFSAWSVRHVTEDGWEDDTRRLITEISEATSLPVGPDVDELLRKAGQAQQRVAELEEIRHLQADQITALHGALAELTRKLAEASSGERGGLAAAVAALAQGNSLVAENAFEREYEVQSKVATDAEHARAEAARNVANLALLRDVTKAVSFYRKALAVEPEHAETARLLGFALVIVGDLRGAEMAFSQSLRAAIAQRDSRAEMQAHLALGHIFRAIGSLAAAKHAFTTARWLAQRRLAADPANTVWQHDLGASHDSVGDVLMAQRDRAGALGAYRRSLGIAETLAARDPANMRWQRDLSVSHDKIGDVLEAQGDGAGALGAYRKSLAIRELLVARDPANLQSQRDVGASHDRIGGVLLAQGDGAGALDAYRRSLGIAETLAARDPANTQWQRDLSVAHEKVGDVLEPQRDRAGALGAYRKSLAIREPLVARDPANTQWQRDLSVAHEKIGDVLEAQGDGAGALGAYRKSLAIREPLAARDPANTQWQRDLSVSHNRIGNVLKAQGDGAGALGAYRRSVAIHEALAARDPATAQWQMDLALSFYNLGTLEHGQSIEERRASLLRGRKILLVLRSEGRLVTSKDWIKWFEHHLRALG